MADGQDRSDGMGPSSAALLAAAVMDRVVSINAIFFGHAAGLLNTDTFDVNQAVDILWREFIGRREVAARRAVRRGLPGARQQALESETRGSTAVLSAIDGLEALMDEELSERDRLRRAMASAINVALELDTLEVPPPAGHSGWVPFELRGQAELFEVVSAAAQPSIDERVLDLRLKAGESTMSYRQAMKSLLGIDRR